MWELPRNWFHDFSPRYYDNENGMRKMPWDRADDRYSLHNLHRKRLLKW
jgi:hypothetical protein